PHRRRSSLSLHDALPILAGRFEGLGPRKLADKVRAHAERLDQQGALERNEIAYSERRVTVRPAAYGMAWVTALVSTQQAVGILADRKSTRLNSSHVSISY